MYERVMIFVDGSNLLRGMGQELKTMINSLKPTVDELTLAFRVIDSLWSDQLDHNALVGSIQGRVVRRFWFGSFQGSEEDGNDLRERIRKANFEPVLFKMPKSKGKEKRVDLAISREMLINSFNKNLEIAVLVAGDEDYVDLVHDVKRYGIRVTGAFFAASGASPHLKLAVDYFHPLNSWGMNSQELIKKIKAS